MIKLQTPLLSLNLMELCLFVPAKDLAFHLLNTNHLCVSRCMGMTPFRRRWNVCCIYNLRKKKDIFKLNIQVLIWNFSQVFSYCKLCFTLDKLCNHFYSHSDHADVSVTGLYFMSHLIISTANDHLLVCDGMPPSDTWTIRVCLNCTPAKATES